MPKPVKPTGPGTRGPQVYNESADRTMKYYMVAEIELRGLTRSGVLTTLGFSVAGAAITMGIDALRDYNAGSVSAMAWVVAAGIVALPFLILGAVGLVQRHSIMTEIRQGRSPV